MLSPNAAVDESCAAVSDLVGRLNPGFWAPAYVFRSLSVRPGAIHPPNLTRAANDVQLLGACDAPGLRADSFKWNRPTSDGGDWIASTTARPVQISIDGVVCPLTGLALTTSSWPSLRLQFEECPRKTAVEVPLVNTTQDRRFKIIHWMCKVAQDSELCAKIAEKLPVNVAAEASGTDWASQEYLDLTQLLAVASKGATRMQIYNSCFENLDWFVINTPLAVDLQEFEMLLALKGTLTPTLQSPVQIEANIVVETVCIPDCQGHMPSRCMPRLQQASDAEVAPGSEFDWEDFMDTVQEKDVKPWMTFFFACFFLAGSAASCACMSCLADSAKKPERKIKQVSVVYHDVQEPSHSFFTRGS